MRTTTAITVAESLNYSDREIVALCLAPLGLAGRRVELGREATLIARGLADGFGKLSITDPTHADMLWDWSHVRDSTPEAFAKVARFVRACIAGEVVL